MADISLRPATPADAGQIAQVHRQSRADYYGEPPAEDDREAMWVHLVAQPDRTTYLSERAGSVVAFISAHRLPGPEAALELTALYVLPDLYGRGIGGRLHDVFDRERGNDRAGVLEVWAGNRRAITFYERRGWVPTDRTRPGPQDIDFVTYRLEQPGHPLA
ncbi:GNAT family N-acetyltransferase [Nocardioides conyzicola]|uniref:N-acetyltransferase domain-containing protein n=1 Tax=Nocardioides conyzicola TaxID=1651781 RepID=A0ABP8XRW0_9ACTN